MAEGYKIRSHGMMCGTDVLVLMPESNDEDFLERMEASPKGRGRFRLILRTIEKIGQAGIAMSRHVGFIRTIDGPLGLVEVAVSGKVVRVMSYLHDESALVLLFDFDGHQGSDKIKRKDLERGRRLAAIARKCMEE